MGVFFYLFSYSISESPLMVDILGELISPSGSQGYLLSPEKYTSVLLKKIKSRDWVSQPLQFFLTNW